MLRYSLLTAGLMLGASAFAAPAGDLPLMPWPAKVERPTTQGALVLNNQLTVSVSGDDLGMRSTACASASPCKLAGRYSRRPKNLTIQPSVFPSLKSEAAAAAGQR